MRMIAALLAFSALVAPAMGAGAPPAPAGTAATTPAAVAMADRRFAISLYRQLARGNSDNIFFSPVSIATAFGPLSAGAAGATARAITDTLAYPVAGPGLHPALGGLGRALQRQSQGATLNIANGLWLDPRVTARPAFLETARGQYGATVEALDFHDAAAAAARINAWSGQHTNGRIPTLVAPSDLPPDTRLVLTNAVFFLADWAAPFIHEATGPLPFTRGDGHQADVPMMRQRGDFRHVRGAGFAALDLPYRDERLTMTVLLPDGADGLGALEESLSAGVLDRTLAALDRATPVEVDLQLPRLELRTDYRLGETLKHMGMEQAFGLGADFSGISETPIAIGEVIHKTFLRVDEAGTEAAAATAIVGIVITGARIAPRPVQFHADHPFLFMLRDRESGAILFFGRITSPE